MGIVIATLLSATISVLAIVKIDKDSSNIIAMSNVEALANGESIFATHWQTLGKCSGTITWKCVSYYTAEHCYKYVCYD